jgi:hypothetical protein
MRAIVRRFWKGSVLDLLLQALVKQVHEKRRGVHGRT